jgi:uncharacterized protein YodC (DUF2158 family)
VNHDAVANGDYETYKKWSEISERGKCDIERGSSAVLAAFGQNGQEAHNLLDWAESILCNSKPMSHCTDEEWDATIKKWRDQRHSLLAVSGQPSLEAAIARMEAVTDEALQKAYWNGHSAVVSKPACSRVRARLIAARHDGQPADFKTAAEELWNAATPDQFIPPAEAEIPWIEWHGGPCPLRDDEVEEWECKYRTITSKAIGLPSTLRWNHNYLGNGPSNGDIIAYRVLRWKKKPKPTPEPAPAWQPAVGDTVRLKSGGPVMVLRCFDRDDPVDVWCHWFDGAKSCGESFPAACLTPAKEEQP